MKLPSALDDGSHLRDKLIVALVESGIQVRKISEETYEVTNADGDPYVYELPEIVGYRMVQMFIDEFGLLPEELIKPMRGTH